jgi:hypothetical protein
MKNDTLIENRISTLATAHDHTAKLRDSAPPVSVQTRSPQYYIINELRECYRGKNTKREGMSIDKGKGYSS